MQKLVFTNGGGQTIDLTSGNFGITNWEGLSNTGLNIQTQQVPFQDGGVFLDALMEQREISVTVAIQDNNDLSLRYELKRQLISALNPKLGEGVLVYTNDYLSRQIKAVPQLPIFENKNSNDAGTLKASVVFSCPSPYWEDLEETSVLINVGQTVNIQNSGEVPAQIKVDVEAGSNNPIIMNGTTEKKIELDLMLDNGLEINTEQGKKEVVKLKRNLVWQQGGAFNYSDYGNGIFFYESLAGNVTENIVNGKKEGNTTPIDYNTHAISGLGVIFLNGSWFLLSAQITSPSRTTIYYGTDGKTWKKISFGFSNKTINDIRYYKGKYIVVGIDGYIATSEDLITWTELTPLSTTLYSLTYSKGMDLFVVVGNGGKIWTSRNLTTWTSRTSGVSSAIMQVIYTGIFVAITTGNILYSTNGTSWLVSALADSTVGLQKICYGNGRYVTVGTNGYIYTSEDLATWARTSIGTSGTKALSYGGGVFSYANYSAKTIYKSTNGTEWQLQADWSVAIKDVAIGNGKCIAIDNDMNLLTSIDEGKTWTTEESGLVGINHLAYGDGLFIATGNNGYIATSGDGSQWTQRTSGVSYNLGRIRYFSESNKYVILGENGNYLYSDGGINWSEGTLGVSATFNDITYGNGMYLVCGTVSNTGYVYKSTDLQNWTSVQTGTGVAKTIIYNKNFVAFLNTGISISQDGDSWSNLGFITISGSTYNAVSVGEVMYAVGSYGILEIQNNVVKKINVPSETLYGIAYENNNIVAVGIRRVIIRTELEKQNVVDTLTSDSDMGLNLQTGNNNIAFFADSVGTSATIKYRQKYTGV